MNGEKVWSGVGWGNLPNNGAISFIDASGTSWAQLVASENTTEILIDTNGNKNPNQYGKDRAILVPVYLAFDVIDGGQVFNTPPRGNHPGVYAFRDFPNAISNTTEQQYRCPSMNTHPCYYSSWLTGE